MVKNNKKQPNSEEEEEPKIPTETDPSRWETIEKNDKKKSD